VVYRRSRKPGISSIGERPRRFSSAKTFVIRSSA
jgi:hypothetical protein